MSSQVTDTFTAVVHIDRSFLSVVAAVLCYPGVFDMQYSVSLTEVRIKVIV